MPTDHTDSIKVEISSGMPFAGSRCSVIASIGHLLVYDYRIEGLTYGTKMAKWLTFKASYA
jgi:hypothetical protein